MTNDVMLIRFTFYELPAEWSNCEKLFPLITKQALSKLVHIEWERGVIYSGDSRHPVRKYNGVKEPHVNKKCLSWICLVFHMVYLKRISCRFGVFVFLWEWLLFYSTQLKIPQAALNHIEVTLVKPDIQRLCRLLMCTSSRFVDR